MTKLALIFVTASLLSSVPFYSATARNEAVDLINGAQRDYKAKRFADALEKAKAADTTGNLPPTVSLAVHRMIVAYALAANDIPSAVSELQKMVAAGEAADYDHKLLEQLRPGR